MVHHVSMYIYMCMYNTCIKICRNRMLATYKWLSVRQLSQHILVMYITLDRSRTLVCVLYTLIYLGTADGCQRIENLYHWVPVAHQVSKWVESGVNLVIDGHWRPIDGAHAHVARSKRKQLQSLYTYNRIQQHNKSIPMTFRGPVGQQKKEHTVFIIGQDGKAWNSNVALVYTVPSGNMFLHTVVSMDDGNGGTVFGPKVSWFCRHGLQHKVTVWGHEVPSTILAICIVWHRNHLKHIKSTTGQILRMILDMSDSGLLANRIATVASGNESVCVSHQMPSMHTLQQYKSEKPINVCDYNWQIITRPRSWGTRHSAHITRCESFDSFLICLQGVFCTWAHVS